MDFPLDDYAGWLYKLAASMLPGGYSDPGLDDLAQEGRIAMWKAYTTYDSAKGPLIPRLTYEARMRMIGVSHGHKKPTGHEAVRGFTEAVPEVYIDARENADDLLLAKNMLEFAEPVLMEVLRELPDDQREYIWLRFWCGIEVMSRLASMRAVITRYPVLKRQEVWQQARDTLRDDPRVQALMLTG